MTEPITLFCIPHAGGTKQVFDRFVPHLTDWNVKALELPGKGTRFGEPQLDDLNDIVEDLYNQITSELNGYYCFWGHSMGALLAFLITRKIVKEGKTAPQHLFLTGRTAPTVERKYTRYSLSQEKFVDMLVEMGGMPKEIMEDRELLMFFEPMIRKDFKAVETYEFIQEKPLQVPMTVMIGDQEETTLDEAKEWNLQTSETFETIVFKGGHFFIFDHVQEIVKVVNNSIEIFLEKKHE